MTEEKKPLQPEPGPQDIPETDSKTDLSEEANDKEEDNG